MRCWWHCAKHTRACWPPWHISNCCCRRIQVFREDVLGYVMDEWGAELRKEGHVLEEVTSWKDPASSYPRYELRLQGGQVVDLLFSGIYPESLHLHISKAAPNKNQFSDAHTVAVPLLVSNDPNALLYSIVGGLQDFGKA